MMWLVTKKGPLCTVVWSNLGRNDHQTPAPCQPLCCLEVISPTPLPCANLPGFKGLPEVSEQAQKTPKHSMGECEGLTVNVCPAEHQIFLVQLLSWPLFRARDGILLGSCRERGPGASMDIAVAWPACSVSCPEQLRRLWDTLSWLVVSKGLMNSQNTELIAKGAAGRAGTGFPSASEHHNCPSSSALPGLCLL